VRADAGAGADADADADADAGAGADCRCRCRVGAPCGPLFEPAMLAYQVRIGLVRAPRAGSAGDPGTEDLITDAPKPKKRPKNPLRGDSSAETPGFSRPKRFQSD
jgi:hypothetical protein